jgi:Myb-like DNA-binding protein FlbD
VQYEILDSTQIMSRAHRRGPWVAEEDATLLSLVASRGPNNWVQISQHMHYRSPKQCRERYHQNLKSSLNHEPISAEEGEAIEQMVNEMGKKWAEIARRLGNRSDNAVKNWWNGSQNRRKRNVPGSSLKTLSNRTQPLSAVRTPRSPGRPTTRHRGYDDTSLRCNQGWQDVETASVGHLSLRTEQNQAANRAYNHTSPQSQLYDIHRSQGHHRYHQQQQLSDQPSPTGLNRSNADGHIGQLLPSLGPINTSHSSPSYTSCAIQPPHSATSMDRAPSLVSDHNSTYSISPKTWPSPRPEIPAPLDTSRSRWHDPTHIDRRGSAPAISNLAPLPFTSDEGYVSAILPSASSEHKYLLPTPVGRPASFDGQYGNIHRHCSSNPSISLSPMLERKTIAKEPSSARDTRMNFSSLLN